MRKIISLLLVTVILVGTVSSGAVFGSDGSVCIVSASLSLEDNIHIYFDVIFDGIDRENDEYGMIFWKVPQTVGKYTLENAQESSDAVIVNSASWGYDSVIGSDICTYRYSFSAKEMADLVFAQAYSVSNGKTLYSEIIPYSVHTYAARKLGFVDGVTASGDQTLKDLLRGMLEYGSLSQTYFSYNTGVPANTFLQDDHVHSYGEWSILSETESLCKQVHVCTLCGLAETENKFVTDTEELEFMLSDDGETYLVSGIGTFSGIDITIPDEYNGKAVTGIADNAFKDETSIMSVTLSSTLTEIGSSAFSGCTGLQSITIPAGVQSIYSNVFSGCTDLTEIVFESTDGWNRAKYPTPGSETVVVTDPFANASALTNTHADYYWYKF